MAAKRPMRREPMTTSDRAGDVGRDLARLGGQTRNDVMADRDRGSLSQLGHGSYSVKRDERKGGRR